MGTGLMRKLGFRHEKIYGDDGSLYLERYRFRRYRINIFHRPDRDPHCHTHPWGFKTFPLVSYYEEYVRTATAVEHWEHKTYQPGQKYLATRPVPAFKWSVRDADFCHRIIHSTYTNKEHSLRKHVRSFQPQYWAEASKKIITFMITDDEEDRDWGFWVNGVVVPWRTYITSYKGLDIIDGK